MGNAVGTGKLLCGKLPPLTIDFRIEAQGLFIPLTFYAMISNISTIRSSTFKLYFCDSFIGHAQLFQNA